MRVVVYCFGLLLATIACSATSNPDIHDNQDNNQDTTIKTYLALGDSYTIGESVTIKERWPVQLVDSLNIADTLVNAPDIVARTGWNTNQLVDAINSTELDSVYDMVSLLIGVNDQYQGRGLAFMESGFRRLMDMVVDFAGGDETKVFVVSIPDYSVTPFGERDPRGATAISKELSKFNRRQKEICQEKGIAYINITDISLKAKDDSSYLAADKLHPSGKMYAEWVVRILPLAREIITNLK